MGGVRKIFGFEPTIGDMIAQSLRDEHDDWRYEYGDYVNEKRGLKLSIKRFRMLVPIVAGVPLTSREKRLMVRAIRRWDEVRRAAIRQTAHLRFIQGVPVNG